MHICCAVPTAPFTRDGRTIPPPGSPPTTTAGGAKYTRGRLPVEMVYREAFDTRAEAMRREWELKQMTRAQKLALIAHGAGRPPSSQKGIF